jgi:hypothetical protein
MPSFDKFIARKVHRVLLLGHSGVGKTGALGSLINAGYRLFIIDFDNNLEILADPVVVQPQFRKNFFYKTFTDKIKGARALPDGVPQAAQQALACLDGWTEKDDDGKPVNMGSPYTWGPQDVLVLDSLTMFGECLKRYIAALNGHQGRALSQPDWGEAMRIQEDTIASLCSEQIKCNVIIIAHLVPGRDENLEGAVMASGRWFPSALGSKLPPKIPRYFNSVLQIEKSGTGQNVKRVLKTVATSMADLKNPAPSRVPPEMEPDLAKYFRFLEGGAPASAASAPTPVPAVPVSTAQR